MKALELRGLCKRYPGFYLDHISYSLDKGSILGFIGRNGAGKTTTIKTVLGMLHKEEGELLYNGQDCAQSDSAFKQELGVVLSGGDFYPKKKLKTITEVTRRFYPNWQQDKYLHYCRLFSLDETKRMDQLSSGMRVKYLLTLALSHNAKLFILDEPTSGLDPVSRDEIIHILKALVKDGERSVLFSTHITEDLEKCADSIAYIQEGKLVFSGSKEAFLERYKDKGDTLDEIIIGIERRAFCEDAIV